MHIKENNQFDYLQTKFTAKISLKLGKIILREFIDFAILNLIK